MRFSKCPRYLVLCNKSHQNFMAYLKPVFQFDHRFARVWVGLTENGCLLNAASSRGGLLGRHCTQPKTVYTT